MKKIICLLICIFTIICCFGCSSSNTIRLKYEIDGNSVCFMTPNGESLYSFFGIDILEFNSYSTTFITFCKNSDGEGILKCSIRGYDIEKSYFIIETDFDNNFGETLINSILEKSKFIEVHFYKSDPWQFSEALTIVDNQPLKLIKA